MSTTLGSLILEKNLTVRELVKFAAFTTPGEALVVIDNDGNIGTADLGNLNRVQIDVADAGNGNVVGDFNGSVTPISIGSMDVAVVKWLVNDTFYLFIGLSGIYGSGGTLTAQAGDFVAISGSGSSTTEFSDSAFRIFKQSDSSSKIQFNASAISPFFTRQIIMPDYDVNLGDIPSKPLSGVGVPLIVPRYKGDLYVDTSNGNTYMSYNVTIDSWKRTDNIKNEISVVAPTVTDDLSAGFEIFSLWYNVALQTLSYCSDNTNGAAVWVDFGEGTSDFSPEFQDVENLTTLVIGDPVTWNGTNWVKADTSVEANTAQGIVTNLLSGGVFKASTVGELTISGGTFIPKQWYYLSTTGTYTTTEPSEGEIVQLMFFALAADKIAIDMGSPYIQGGLGGGGGGGDMLKSDYATANSTIVDNALGVNDGAGKSKTATEVVDHIDDTTIHVTPDQSAALDANVGNPPTALNPVATIDDISASGGGDMLKATYDTNVNNIVDKAESVDDGAGNVKTASEIKLHIDDTTSNPHAVTAIQTSTDTTGFNGNLSPTDNTVQKALDTLDDMSVGGTGDMTKAVYDTGDSGVVDDSEKLGGLLPSVYDQSAHVADATVHITSDQNDALDGANTPNAANPVATMNDLSGFGAGDMLKADYATVNANLVDGALSINDGAGKVKTAAQVVDHIDDLVTDVKHLTDNQQNALNANVTNPPTGVNPVATIADISAAGGGDMNTSIYDVNTNSIVDRAEQLEGPNITENISTALEVRSHLDDITIHFTESSIDHTAIQNIGTNSHAQIDTHIADATLHFTEGSISHLNITDIGTNSHADIDTHIADASIHVISDQSDALDGADNPNASNVFATMANTKKLEATEARVSFLWGDDATGIIGEYDKPFKTISAATDAAHASGVRVFVEAGFYNNENNLNKNSGGSTISLQLICQLQSVTINNNGSTTPMFNSGSIDSIQPFTITGYPKLNSNSAPIFSMGNYGYTYVEVDTLNNVSLYNSIGTGYTGHIYINRVFGSIQVNFVNADIHIGYMEGDFIVQASDFTVGPPPLPVIDLRSYVGTLIGDFTLRGTGGAQEFGNAYHRCDYIEGMCSIPGIDRVNDAGRITIDTGLCISNDPSGSVSLGLANYTGPPIELIGNYKYTGIVGNPAAILGDNASGISFNNVLIEHTNGGECIDTGTGGSSVDIKGILSLITTANPKIGATVTLNYIGDIPINTDQYEALQAANAPTALNAIATMADIAAAGGGDMLKSVYDIGDNGIVDNAELVNGLTVETAVPVGALFTDTVYDSTAVDAHIANVTTNPHAVDKTDVGLSNVDNTSDLNKPISTLTQAALDLKEDGLGNPTTDGDILSSTIAGVRSWITLSTGADLGNYTFSGDIMSVSGNSALNVSGIDLVLADGFSNINYNGTWLFEVGDQTKECFFKASGTAPDLRVLKLQGSKVILGDIEASWNETQISIDAKSNRIDLGTATDVVINNAFDLVVRSSTNRVGIGVENPTSKLEVAGEIQATQLNLGGLIAVASRLTPTPVVQIGEEFTYIDMLTNVRLANKLAFRFDFDTMIMGEGFNTIDFQSAIHLNDLGLFEDLGGGDLLFAEEFTTIHSNADIIAPSIAKQGGLVTEFLMADGSTSTKADITKADVGLGNVDNTSDLNKPISTATQAALDLKADTSALTTHENDIANPHAVTSTQVGLGNVDNTSDVNKPVSIAQQASLDTKPGKDTTGTTSQVDNFWVGSQVEYDALGTYPNTTTYLII